MTPDEVVALEAAARRFWSTQFVSETPLPTLSVLSAELADLGLELVEKLDLSDSGNPSGPLNVRRKKSTVKMGLLVRKT